MRGTIAYLQHLDVNTLPPTPIKVDNSGVLAILTNVTLPAANRHIYKTIAEARERVNLDGVVTQVKIASVDNIADCLTKPCIKNDKRMLVLARPASLHGSLPCFGFRQGGMSVPHVQLLSSLLYSFRRFL